MSDTYSMFLYPDVKVEAKVKEQSTGFGTIALKFTSPTERLGCLPSVREIVLYYKPELAETLEEAFRRIGLELTVQRISQEVKTTAVPGTPPRQDDWPPDPCD